MQTYEQKSPVKLDSYDSNTFADTVIGLPERVTHQKNQVVKLVLEIIEGETLLKVADAYVNKKRIGAYTDFATNLRELLRDLEIRAIAEYAYEYDEQTTTKNDHTNNMYNEFSQKYALFHFLEAQNNGITFDEIKSGLLSNGFKPKAEFFDNSLHAMLKYYRKKKIFHRDKIGRWWMTQEARNSEIRVRLSETAGSDSVENDLHPELRPPKARFELIGEKSILTYSLDVLDDSDAQSLHADVIRQKIKEITGMDYTRRQVAATLRRNAYSKKPKIKTYGDNTFGKIERARSDSAPHESYTSGVPNDETQTGEQQNQTVSDK